MSHKPDREEPKRQRGHSEQLTVTFGRSSLFNKTESEEIYGISYEKRNKLLAAEARVEEKKPLRHKPPTNYKEAASDCDRCFKLDQGDFPPIDETVVKRGIDRGAPRDNSSAKSSANSSASSSSNARGKKQRKRGDWEKK